MMKEGNRAQPILLRNSCCVFQLLLGLLFILLCIFSFLRGKHSNLYASNLSGFNHSQDIQLNIPAQVEMLIRSLKNATALVATNYSQILSDPEWTSKNPCRSRNELAGFYSERSSDIKDLQRNFAWEAVLSEYAKLHHACIQRTGNLTSYFLHNKTSSACKYVIAYSGLGLGNKILVTVSAFLYAVMTQRVLLIASDIVIPDILCEPFLQSSWRLPEEFPTPDRRPELWTVEEEFFNHVGETVIKRNSSSTVRPLYAVISGNLYGGPSSQFFCPTEFDEAENIPWIFHIGCLYFSPRLFSVPRLRPVLEALFPDYMSLTHMLRSIMLPADPIWARVLSAKEAYLKDADRVVGIQVRYRDGDEHYDSMNTKMDAAIRQCAVENGLLPITDPRGWARASSPSRPIHSRAPIIKVLIASLYSSLHDRLLNAYLKNPTMEGENVAVIQLSCNKYQRMMDLEEDSQALVEMLLLSYSDDLIVTAISTFGGVAQAYGALIPWIINFNRNVINESESVEGRRCLRGQTVDVCYQTAADVYSCPHDPETNGKSIPLEVPYIKRCLPIDSYEDVVQTGIQLITALN